MIVQSIRYTRSEPYAIIAGFEDLLSVLRVCLLAFSPSLIVSLLFSFAIGLFTLRFAISRLDLIYSSCLTNSDAQLSREPKHTINAAVSVVPLETILVASARGDGIRVWSAELSQHTIRKSAK